MLRITEIQVRRGVLQTLREAVQWIKAISAFEAMLLFGYFIIKLTPPALACTA